jgi:hypothetical protein
LSSKSENFTYKEAFLRKVYCYEIARHREIHGTKEFSDKFLDWLLNNPRCDQIFHYKTCWHFLKEGPSFRSHAVHQACAKRIQQKYSPNHCALRFLISPDHSVRSPIYPRSPANESLFCTVTVPISCFLLVKPVAQSALQ